MNWLRNVLSPKVDTIGERARVEVELRQIALNLAIRKNELKLRDTEDILADADTFFGFLVEGMKSDYEKDAQ